MATAWLKREDIEGNALPPICARCGEPTTERVEKDLAGSLFWIDPALALRAWLSGRAKMCLPLCSEHRTIGRGRRLVIPLCAVFIVLAVVGLVFLPAEMRSRSLVEGFMIFLLILAHVPIVAVMILGSSGLRATEAKKDHVIVTGVCEELAARFPIPTLPQFVPIAPLDLDRAVLDRWGERDLRDRPRSPGEDESQRFRETTDRTKSADES